MEQREAFVMACIANEDSMTALCERFGISRRTGYKWLDRFMTGGLAGLLERSRAPEHHPHAVDEATVEAILALKHHHPTWGAKKLLARLSTIEPEVDWPSESTFARILKRNGLMQPRRQRRRTPLSQHKLTVAQRPNDVWCTDFKGKFRVGRKYVHPLTITDAHSRFVLCCQDIEGERLEPTKAAFREVFKEHGLPLRIRSDNGTPFASSAIGGLSRLSVWWVKLGIFPERTRPAHPQDNGSHERMHRTLKAETAKPPRSTQEQQRLAFESWRREYNDERPHEALGMATPSSVYMESPRQMPDEESDPVYPDHFEVRRLHKSGRFSFNNAIASVGAVLGGELLGIEPIEDRLHQLWFGPIFLGQLSERTNSNLVITPNRPTCS